MSSPKSVQIVSTIFSAIHVTLLNDQWNLQNFILHTNFFEPKAQNLKVKNNEGSYNVIAFVHYIRDTLYTSRRSDNADFPETHQFR